MNEKDRKFNKNLFLILLRKMNLLTDSIFDHEIQKVFHTQSDCCPDNQSLNRNLNSMDKLNAGQMDSLELQTYFIEAVFQEKQSIPYYSIKKDIIKLFQENDLFPPKYQLNKYHYDIKIDTKNEGNGIAIYIGKSIPQCRKEEFPFDRTYTKTYQTEKAGLTLVYSGDKTEAENAGIGLFLIIDLLKKMNLNPCLFRIGVIHDHLVSHLEIPL